MIIMNEVAFKWSKMKLIILSHPHCWKGGQWLVFTIYTCSLTSKETHEIYMIAVLNIKYYIYITHININSSFMYKDVDRIIQAKDFGYYFKIIFFLKDG